MMLPNAPTLRLFTDWISRGVKYAYIAGGASIYALLLVAGMGIKNKIRKESVYIIWEMGKMLRNPSCVASGKSIISILK